MYPIVVKQHVLAHRHRLASTVVEFVLMVGRRSAGSSPRFHPANSVGRYRDFWSEREVWQENARHNECTSVNKGFRRMWVGEIERNGSPIDEYPVDNEAHDWWRIRFHYNFHTYKQYRSFVSVTAVCRCRTEYHVYDSAGNWREFRWYARAFSWFDWWRLSDRYTDRFSSYTRGFRILGRHTVDR